jgi:ABC-type Fe3+-siderophore transport system permease subunit
MLARGADMNRLIGLKVAEAIFRLVAAGFGLFRLFGVVFFASSTNFIFTIPAIVLLCIAVSPIRIWDSRKFPIKVLLLGYLLSYFFGGFKRIFEYQQYFPDFFEFLILTAFCIYLWLVRSHTEWKE